MKKFFKFITAVVSIGGILYIARDQIKEIYNKIMELIGKDDFDDFDEEPFDDDFTFPDKGKEDRDYVSIHITDDDVEEDTTDTTDTEDMENAEA